MVILMIFKKFLFINICPCRVLATTHGVFDLCCSMQDLLIVACGIYFPD